MRVGTHHFIALTTLLGAASACADPRPVPPGVQTLLAAERDFAAAAAAEGLRPAFVPRLAAMAVLLAPRPVRALDWLREHPFPEGTWTWRPEFVEVSGAGDLGYTAGPWRFVLAESSEPATGWYVSIWRHHPRTGWKLLLRVTTDAAAPWSLGAGGGAAPGDASAVAAEPAVAIGSRNVVFPHDSLAIERRALLDADRVLGELASTAGMRVSLARAVADDVRFLRSGSSPAMGREAALAAAPESTGRYAWEPVSSWVAESGDLGYTLGNFQFTPAGAPPESTSAWSHVHIWRRDPSGKRRLALDLAIPVPQPR